jgi:hypothetical protein
MEDEGIAETAKAIKQLAEAVPVYQDAIQPTAKTLGAALAPIGTEVGRAVTVATKAVNIALAPLHGMVWGWEQLEKHVFPALGRKIEGKLERLTTPQPNVAVPILEALRYNGSIPTLREMYVNLLATSMDAETAQMAHPGFVEIIKVLTPDEALVIKLLVVRKHLPIVSLWANVFSDGHHVSQTEVLHNFSHIAEEVGCQHAALATSYLDNIQRLGLATITPGARIMGDNAYEPLVNDTRVQDKRRQLDEQGLHHTLKEGSFSITDYGVQFCDACMDKTV